MFKIWQGINPMGLSASLVDYLITILYKHKNVTNILNMKKRNQGIDPMGICSPWAKYFIIKQEFYQNIDDKKILLFVETLDHSLNHCYGLTQ